MPVEPIESGVISNTGEPDLSDSGLGIEREPVQSSAPGGEVGGEQDQDFGGLPFKNLGEFVKGHKSLQEEYRNSRDQFYQMQNYLRQVAPLLQKLQTSQPRAVENLDIPKFLESLIQGPHQTIDSRADRRIEAKLGDFRNLVAPLQQELNRMRTEKEIDRFMGEHSEVKPEDETALLDIFRSTPWLQQMQGSVYDKLDAALMVLNRKEPGRFSGREDRREAGRALNSMKQSAGAVGSKGGTKTRSGPRDEFDAVLEDDAASRALWR